MSETLPIRDHRSVLAEHVSIAGRRVIDVGCGSGELVRWLAAQGADVIGVECGEIMRELALAADPDHQDRYVDAVAQALPLPEQSADVVVFSYSLHHVPHESMHDALRETARVLVDDGVLYVVEPVAAGPGHEVIRVIDDETEVRAHAQAALARAADVGLAPVATDRYVNRMRVADAETLGERVVGVDPRRAERYAARRGEFAERFAALARRDGDAFVFDQENLVRTFRRVRSAAPR